MNEGTDVAQCSPLLVFVRYIANEKIYDELLFFTELETTTKAIDIMSAILQFVEKYGLSWEKLLGVCTDAQWGI